MGTTDHSIIVCKMTCSGRERAEGRGTWTTFSSYLAIGGEGAEGCQEVGSGK
jgi:hypothetical protein